MSEVDENGHGDYDQEDEEIRITQLIEDIRNLKKKEKYNVHVIRFNPDKYINAGGIVMKSIFVKINKVWTTTNSFNARLAILKTEIEACFKTKYKEPTLQPIIYLFFDGYD